MTISVHYESGRYRAISGNQNASDELSAYRAAKKLARVILKQQDVIVHELRPGVWAATVE